MLKNKYKSANAVENKSNGIPALNSKPPSSPFLILLKNTYFTCLLPLPVPCKKHAGKCKFLIQFQQNCVNINKNRSGMCNMLVPYNNTNQIKSNQITFIVTSPQHKCLGEWNSYERAPDSAKKQNNNLHMDSTYLQTVQKTMCKIHIHILSTHSVL